MKEDVNGLVGLRANLLGYNFVWLRQSFPTALNGNDTKCNQEKDLPTGPGKRVPENKREMKNREATRARPQIASLFISSFSRPTLF